MLITSWRDFAEITVDTHDLDPMYDLIYGIRRRYGMPAAERYALHFFLFYDAGEAAGCMFSKVPFWTYIDNNYRTCRRGTERRHFRGDNGSRAIAILRTIGEPRDVWGTLYRPNYDEFVHNVNTNFKGCQIGPYFMWKAMDIFDRCLGQPMELYHRTAAKYMPEEPLKCAKAVWPDSPAMFSLERVVTAIAHLTAPGEPNRACSYPEAETVLCMMKGYFITKTHTVGDDVAEKHRQLKDYPLLTEILPKQQDWKQYVRGALDPS